MQRSAEIHVGPNSDFFFVNEVRKRSELFNKSDFLAKVEYSASAAKKVRKGGIMAALRTFLIFVSAFGPHWTQKVGTLPSIDEVC